MPDYTFYKEQFAGEDIPESEFPRFLKRAEIELKRMRRIYPMTPAGAYTEDAAAEMALCAIADAMYEFAQEEARSGAGEHRQRERDLHRPAGALRPHAGRPRAALPARGRVLLQHRAVGEQWISSAARP